MLRSHINGDSGALYESGFVGRVGRHFSDVPVPRVDRAMK